MIGDVVIPVLPNIRPKYFYDFNKPKTSPPGMTFARASELGHPFNGMRRVVGTDVPLTCDKGLIIERQSINYMASANGPSIVADSNTKAKILDATMPSPGGVVSIATAAASVSTLVGYRQLPAHRANNTDYCLSAYVKRGSARFASLIFSSYNVSVSPIEAYFDFDTEEIIATRSGLIVESATLERVGVENVGGGWYRIWVNTRTISNATDYSGFFAGIYFRGNNGATVNTGNVVANSVVGYFCGAQVEIGKYPTSYIQTNGASTTRAKSAGEIKVDPMSAYSVVLTYRPTKVINSSPLGLYTNNTRIGSIFATDSDGVMVNRLLIDSSLWCGEISSDNNDAITVIATLEPGKARYITSVSDDSYQSVTHSLPTEVNLLKLGESTSTIALNYDGFIKNIAVYNKALTEQEMRALIKLYR